MDPTVPMMIHPGLMIPAMEDLTVPAGDQAVVDLADLPVTMDLPVALEDVGIQRTRRMVVTTGPMMILGTGAKIWTMTTAIGSTRTPGRMMTR